MDWARYNECLVKRVQLLLDFSVLEGWDREVRYMNAGKKGRPFTYPESKALAMQREGSENWGRIYGLRWQEAKDKDREPTTKKQLCNKALP